MTRTVRLPAEFTLRPGARRLVEIEGFSIILFNIGGSFYAIEDSCPHHGASMARGRLEGCTLECPAHGLKFDLRTGEMRFGGLTARIYPVSCADGIVEIGLPE
jgi:3-phenylpropionate/trans-cinnamate dioxygenase ferredoxin subunit